MSEMSNEDAAKILEFQRVRWDDPGCVYALNRGAAALRKLDALEKWWDKYRPTTVGPYKAAIDLKTILFGDLEMPEEE